MVDVISSMTVMHRPCFIKRHENTMLELPRPQEFLDNSNTKPLHEVGEFQFGFLERNLAETK